MLRPLQKVVIEGEEREFLYTLSLYKVLQDRKQTVVIEKDATWQDVNAAYLKMMYAAYINAIEVRQIDDPSYNPNRLKYMELVVWSEEHPEAFAEQFKVCYKFLTGKELELNTEKKKTQSLKRPSIWRRIGKAIFNRS
jgi:hypothetical protein